MKALPPALQAHLQSGTTTLCHCWRLERHDGAVMGFTDHDEDLVFDGVTYEAAAGFAASAISSTAGLAVDNLDVVGALSSDRLTDRELANGQFDDAEIEIWRVNWQDVDQRVLLRKGNLGEVSHSGLGFHAEVRGAAHKLNQPTGRLFQFSCDADFADAKCGLPGASHTYAAIVLKVTGNRELLVSGLEGFSSGWFARGLCTFTSGLNTGTTLEVKGHARRNGDVVLEFWHAPSVAINAGDTVSVLTGCDKQFSTCQQKFDNAVNFRGFPHMPGNDFALSYPVSGQGNDGGSQV